MKPIEGSKAIKYDDDESLERKQETYNKLFDEKLDEIQELSKDYSFQENKRWRHIARNGRRRSKKI